MHYQLKRKNSDAGCVKMSEIKLFSFTRLKIWIGEQECENNFWI